MRLSWGGRRAGEVKAGNPLVKKNGLPRAVFLSSAAMASELQKRSKPMERRIDVGKGGGVAIACRITCCIALLRSLLRVEPGCDVPAPLCQEEEGVPLSYPKLQHPFAEEGAPSRHRKARK